MSIDLAGCTVGLVSIPGGMLCFKNRDLAGPYVRNRITAFQSTPEYHVLRGVNLKTGALEGVSIGINRRRVCVANTHVISSDDPTYDLLCERLILEVQGRPDVRQVVQRFVGQHRVQGGRILVVALDWAFLVEVYQDRFEMQEVTAPFVMTNTFSLLRPVQAPPQREESSASRLQVAGRLLPTVSHVGQLKSLLRSHLPEKGELSICNHREDGGGTESSHIIQLQGKFVGWSSLVGPPCEGDYRLEQLFSAYK